MKPKNKQNDCKILQVGMKVIVNYILKIWSKRLNKNWMIGMARNLKLQNINFSILPIYFAQGILKILKMHTIKNFMYNFWVTFTWIRRKAAIIYISSLILNVVCHNNTVIQLLSILIFYLVELRIVWILDF